MTGDSAEHAGVFVLHFALNDAMAKGAIVGRGRNTLSQAFAGLNVVCAMASGPKISRWQNASSGSSASRSSATPRMMKPMSLYSARVPGMAASSVVKAARKSSSRVLCAHEKFFVSGQSGAMCQQHAEGDLAALGCVRDKFSSSEFGDDRGERRFQIQHPAFVEDHRHRGRSDDLGHRREVEDAGPVTAGDDES